MSKPLRVLLVEDNPDDAELLLRQLRKAGYDPHYQRVDTPGGMSHALGSEMWDLVLSDYHMPTFSGFAALKLLQETRLDIPFIIVSGNIGEETAVAAMKAGAHDYIMKDNLTRLGPTVERELREAVMRRERRRAEETVRYQAYYDMLTGLPNRTLLHQRLQEELIHAQEQHEALSLLVMDLDRFKEVNATLGHHNGDLLLQQVGTRVASVLREGDMVVRLGGDEFAALLTRVDATEAARMARLILEAFQPSFRLGAFTVEVSPSIGVAVFPEHGRDADTMLRRADVAMYVAKQSGSGFAVYDPELDPHSPRRLALVGNLRHAIEENQLFLVYQPKVDLHLRRVTGVEALVRWNHPEFQVVPPDQFISLAEQTGLIKPLTMWVLRRALQQCREWKDQGLDLCVAVNVSARNLQCPTLPEQVAEILEQTGVPAANLELELTESSIMADPVRSLEILGRLSAMGIRLSIDDFGTGYSSLGYLKKLPADAVKIDKSFVSDMVHTQDDEVIVQSTIGLAHTLGLEVIAEGVENAEVCERLAQLDCDAAQGHFISRPIPAGALMEWMRHSPMARGVMPFVPQADMGSAAVG
ncbi:MAG: EAL domain-containing protein [Myxococcota bacterium]